MVERHWLPGAQEQFLRGVGLADAVHAAGDYLVLGGQVGQAPDGSIPDGLEAQAKQVMDNIKAIVESAGGSMADVVHLTCLLTQETLDQKKEWWGILTDLLATYMPSTQPAATGYWVTELASRRYLVEIQATAVLGSG